MKLYAKFHPSGLCLELMEVADHVVMPAPYVLQTPEVYAEWKAQQGVPPPEPPPSNDVPEEVALWRIKTVTDIAGLTAQIEAAIDAMPEPQRTVARRAWFDGNVMVRSSAMVTGLSAQLGLTSAQVDALFLQAAALEA